MPNQKEKNRWKFNTVKNSWKRRKKMPVRFWRLRRRREFKSRLALNTEGYARTERKCASVKLLVYVYIYLSRWFPQAQWALGNERALSETDEVSFLSSVIYSCNTAIISILAVIHWRCSLSNVMSFLFRLFLCNTDIWIGLVFLVRNVWKTCWGSINRF